MTSRLPNVGGDDDAWGGILDDFLLQEHNADGSIKTRDALLGYKKPTFDLAAASGSTVTSQIIFGSAVFLRKGETVTNIITAVTTAAAGTTPTTIRLGIMSSALVMQAITGNLNANAIWTSVGTKAAPLSAAWVVPSDGIYFIVLISNGAFGTTALQLAKAQSSIATLGQALAGFPPKYGQFGAAQTDLPAVGASASAWSSNATFFWFAFN